MDVKRRHVYFTISLISAILSLLFLHGKFNILNVYNVEKIEYQPEESLVITKDDIPVILFWTDYFGKPFTLQKRDYDKALETLAQCPQYKCTISTDHEELLSSSAVIFHVRELENGFYLPSVRLSWQYYVFFLYESPMHTGVSLSLFPEGYFNLTFTYRLDSDIRGDLYTSDYHPRIWSDFDYEFNKLWKWKKQRRFDAAYIAYFESYCAAPSQRRLIVNELARSIPVDIYGRCGFLKCDPQNETLCGQVLSTYKFYLAFENSLCRDYMTEKAYRALNYGTIPIVYGSANYSTFLPPGSFISVWDFDTISDLAAYIHRVANDKKLYREYFRWRSDKKWKHLDEQLQSRSSSWCRLCELLHHKPRQKKIINDLQAWWGNGTCEFAYVNTPATKEPLL